MPVFPKPKVPYRYDVDAQVARLRALFYGLPAKADIQRRALETVAVAKWTRAREKSRFLGLGR